MKGGVAMERKGKELLRELLKDADDFATFKRIACPPIYLLGGSACILGGYLERATFDLDFIDIGYKASAGKVFRLFDRFDMLDLYVTPVAEGFEQRAALLEGFSTTPQRECPLLQLRGESLDFDLVLLINCL